MKHLVIVGAGEFGRELYWHSQFSRGYGTEFDLKGYIDDVMAKNPSDTRYKNVPLPLLSSIDEYKIEQNDIFICAMGTPCARETVIAKMREKGAEFMNMIHNTSLIQGHTELGKGIFMGPYTVIGDSVSIGDHVMLNTHSSIGHDAIIKDFTCIMSYVDITGGCRVEQSAFLGSGCRLVPGSQIGRNAYVGIGSVVLRRVKDGQKVFGNPAKAYEI